jgi:5-methyltetrahydrofolate--homocysteine methyltransferase
MVAGYWVRLEMSEKKMKELLDVLLDFHGIKIKEYCKGRLEEGIDPYEIFKELATGLEEIGRGFESKEFKRYFTSDLIVSGANMKRAIELLRPHFKRDMKGRGRVVIGTVKGDVHDIGKNIFSVMLESNGFEVIDLGVDVKKEMFIEKVKEVNADLLAMSALLTSTYRYMGEVVKALRKEDPHGNVKVIIGGRPVTEEYAREIGVDAYGRDAVDGLRKCLSLLGARAE